MSADPRYKSQRWLDLRERVKQSAGGKCEVPGCTMPGTHADHIRSPRNGGDFWDIANLRWLCATHDSAVKELPTGKRRGGGHFRIKGCDANGQPLDPQHAWRAKR